MSDFFAGCILGAILSCAIQLSSIKNALHDVKEELYGIKIRLNWPVKCLPTDKDEEESADA